MHETDSHDDRLMMALHRLLPLPRALCSKIEELTYVDLCLCDFDICDSLVLILHGDMAVFAGCAKQIMLWCPLMLACDADVEDDGGW